MVGHIYPVKRQVEKDLDVLSLQESIQNFNGAAKELELWEAAAGSI